MTDDQELVGVLLEGAIETGRTYGDKYGRDYLENRYNWFFLDFETLLRTNRKLLENGGTKIILYSIDQNWPGIADLLYGNPKDN